MSRVTRKREAAHRRLLDAAQVLIAEKGIDGLRIREVAELADVGSGSFYTHFETKDAVVEAVVADRVSAISEALMAQANSYTDAAEVIAVAHRGFLATASEEPTLARLMLQIERGEALLTAAAQPVLTDVLERGVTAGRFPPLDTDLMVSFAVGATMSVLRGLVDGTLEPSSASESARALLRACGIADAEALELATRDFPALSG